MTMDPPGPEPTDSVSFHWLDLPPGDPAFNSWPRILLEMSMWVWEEEVHIKLTWTISERGKSSVSYINNLQRGLRASISSVNLAKTKSVDNIMRVVKPWKYRTMVMVLRAKGKMWDSLLCNCKHSESGVLGSSQSLDRGAGNWTQVLC